MGLSLIVAFVAGCGNVLLTNPIWVVATRMQAQQNSKQGEEEAGPLAVAQEIVDESGVKVHPFTADASTKHVLFATRYSASLQIAWRPSRQLKVWNLP